MLTLPLAIRRRLSLRTLAASDYGQGIRRRIERLFPHRSPAEHDAILYAFLRYRLLNRIVYRLTVMMPSIAALISLAIPVTGRPRMRAAKQHDGPLIIASAHFGSLYFLTFIIARALPGRRLYLMHKRHIADAARNEVFLRRRGIVPVAADEHGLRTLVRALQDDPRTAILLAFDPPMSTRHVVPFLATRIPVWTGVGLLADIGRCPVVPWFWHYNRGWPSVCIEQPIFADRTLTTAQRRTAVVERLYALLEQRVARAPEQWQLDFIADHAVPQAATVATER